MNWNLGALRWMLGIMVQTPVGENRRLIKFPLCAISPDLDSIRRSLHRCESLDNLSRALRSVCSHESPREARITEPMVIRDGIIKAGEFTASLIPTSARKTAHIDGQENVYYTAWAKFPSPW